MRRNGAAAMLATVALGAASWLANASTCEASPVEAQPTERYEIRDVLWNSKAVTDSASNNVEPIFLDGFEDGMGNWDVSDPAGSGAQWGDSDCWAASGTRSARCSAGGMQATACGEDYPANMKTWMVHGPFSLADSTICTAELEFTVKLDAETGLDGFFAGVSTNGADFSGIELTGVEESTRVLDLTPLLGAPEVWIGFRFHSDGSVARPDGAQVDDVVVWRSPPAPPPRKFGWTLSASPTDPRVHITAQAPSLLYLWYYCSEPAGLGIAAAEFRFSPAYVVIFVAPRNGFLNAGSWPTVILTHAGCPTPPILAAEVYFSGTEACFHLCWRNISTDCEEPPGVYSNYYTGWAMWPGIPCQTETLCGIPTSMQPMTWGSIKALYR